MNFLKYIAVAFFLSVAVLAAFDVKEYLKEIEIEEEQKSAAFKFLKENVTTIGASSRYDILRSMPDLGVYYIIRSDEFIHSGKPVRLHITQVAGDFVESKAQWIDLGFSTAHSGMFVAQCWMATEHYRTISQFYLQKSSKEEDKHCLFISSFNAKGGLPDLYALPPVLRNSAAHGGLHLSGSVKQKNGISLQENNGDFSLVQWESDASGIFSIKSINNCCDALSHEFGYINFTTPFNLIEGGFALFETKKYPHDNGDNFRLFSYADGNFSQKMFIEVRKQRSNMKFMRWLDPCRMSVIFKNEKSENNIGVWNFCKPMPIEVTI